MRYLSFTIDVVCHQKRYSSLRRWLRYRAGVGRGAIGKQFGVGKRLSTFTEVFFYNKPCQIRIMKLADKDVKADTIANFMFLAIT